jgi:hypothetical protein
LHIKQIAGTYPEKGIEEREEIEDGAVPALAGLK